MATATKSAAPAAAKLGEIIRDARLSRNLTQKQLGDLIGAHMQTVNKIERGEILYSHYFTEIERHLGLKPGTLTSHKPLRATTGPRPTKGGDDMPVYRTELADLRSGAMNATIEPVGYANRPSPLVPMTDGYCIYISTGHHAPLFEIGDVAFVMEHKPPKPGGDVLLRMKARDKGGRVIIGRLLTLTNTHYTLLRLVYDLKDAEVQRSVETKISRSEFPICHRVIGRMST